MDAVRLELAENRGVEGRGNARRAGQVLWALAHAVVHVVALGRDDPVLPLDVTELDVEVLLAAHALVLSTTQGALRQGVRGLVIPETHLGYQERLVGRVVRITQVLPSVLAMYLQLQAPLAAVQEGL